MGKDDTGLVMKYFVLKPKGKDAYAFAARKALVAYAHFIEDTNKGLAADLYQWAGREEFEKEKQCQK